MLHGLQVELASCMRKNVTLIINVIPLFQSEYAAQAFSLLECDDCGIAVSTLDPSEIGADPSVVRDTVRILIPWHSIERLMITTPPRT